MTTLEMRARSTGEIIDAAFTLLREYFGILFGIAVITQGVPVVFNVYLQFSDALLTDPWMYLIAMVLSALGGLLAAAAILHTVSEAYLGREPDMQTAMGFAVSKIWPLFIAGLSKYLIMMLVFIGGGTIAAIAIGAGAAVIAAVVLLATLVGAVIVACGYALVSQAVVLEQPDRATDALSRSWELTRGFRGKVFVVGFLTYLLAYLPAFGIQVLAGVAAAFGSGFEVLLTLIGSLAVLPLFPVIGCSFTLLYYDLRLRKEAFDLEFLTTEFETVTEEQTATVEH